MKYTITLLPSKESAEFSCCERLPQSGDRYQFARVSRTPRGIYFVGDELIIIERTGLAPHGLISSLGNLLVKCKYAVSVWTNIEHAIDQGVLVLVKANEIPCFSKK